MFIRIIKFKKQSDAKTFDMLLKSANMKYSFEVIKRNDRKGTILYCFKIELF